MIDWERVAELRSEIGADGFDEVVEIFLEEVEQGMSRLRGPAPPDDLEAALHFLKGSALNLGFTSFSKLCQLGETAAANGAGHDVDIAKIVDCYDHSKSEFLAALTNLDAA